MLTWNNVLHSFVRKNVFYSKNIQYAYNFYGTDQNICRGVFRNQSNIYGGASSSLQKSQKIILAYHLQDFIKKLHVLLERSCSVKRAEQSLTTKKVLKKLKHQRQKHLNSTLFFGCINKQVQHNNQNEYYFVTRKPDSCKNAIIDFCKNIVPERRSNLPIIIARNIHLGAVLLGVLLQRVT